MRLRKIGRLKHLSDAFATDACPLCAFLKEFQSSCVGSLRSRTAESLRSYHTWLIAKRAEAAEAAEVFMRVLDRALRDDSKVSNCDVCARIAQEENLRIKEFAENLNEPEFLQSLHESSGLCLPHARRLLKRVPKTVQGDILTAIQRKAAELRRELTNLLHDARSGTPVRGGVLGRVAEYLVAQRGLVLSPKIARSLRTR